MLRVKGDDVSSTTHTFLILVGCHTNVILVGFTKKVDRKKRPVDSIYCFWLPCLFGRCCSHFLLMFLRRSYLLDSMYLCARTAAHMTTCIMCFVDRDAWVALDGFVCYVPHVQDRHRHR